VSGLAAIKSARVVVPDLLLCDFMDDCDWFLDDELESDWLTSGRPDILPVEEDSWPRPGILFTSK